MGAHTARAKSKPGKKIIKVLAWSLASLFILFVVLPTVVGAIARSDDSTACDLLRQGYEWPVVISAISDAYDISMTEAMTEAYEDVDANCPSYFN